MNLLLDFLQTRRSLRYLGHGLGLFAGAGLLWSSGHAWAELWSVPAGFAAMLFAVELALSLIDFKKRRLKKLAPDCFPLKNLSEADRAFVQARLARSPQTAFRRAVLVWVLAAVAQSFFHVFGGLLFYDEAFFLSLALPVSALTQAYGSELFLKRVLPFFYFEGDYAKRMATWLPDLSGRLRSILAVPLVLALAPLAAAFVMALPLGAGSLLWIAAWGGLAVLGGAWALGTLVAEPIQDLQQALHRFGQGDLQALLDVTSGDEVGHATETYNKTIRAVDRRFFVLERFGHAVAPAKSEQLFEGGLRLDGELRAIAVLECAWHNVDAATKGAEPVARLATLNRFYEVIQDAVDKAQGAVLQAGEGRVLAVWGAPLADEQAVQGALAAAWSLKTSMKVWASQQFLRGGSTVQWGLGLASGQATVGLLGPKGRQRYAVLGGPVTEVRGLAQREGGPWIDERSAGAARQPFAVQILPEGAQLVAGPEPESPTAADLGFKPGEML